MIPKKIYQTHKDYNLSEEIKKLIHDLTRLNHDFEYTFMDNDECYEFIRVNFDDGFVSMYKNLPLDIMRADVWRIAVVYINGGIYCDCDVFCRQNLAPLIKNEELVLFTEELGGTSNFFFAAPPKNPALKDVLDLMVDNQSITRDTHSDWLVQNFGMDLFHRVMSNIDNKKLLSYQDSRRWVYHLWYNSWKKSEEDYKNTSNSTKPVTFFTTFHQNGYDLYGKVWIDSFIKNVAGKRNNIKAIIYAHNIKNLNVSHPQIEIIDYDSTLPEHKKWKQDYNRLSKHSTPVKNFTIRFSHKGFAIQHALSTIKEGYSIWADGDVVFKDADYSNFPSCLFKKDEVLACQVEDGNHVESGVIIFDMTHPDMHKFRDAYSHNYSLNEIVNNYGEPYDGHVARRSLVHSGVNYVDLNDIHGRGGIQSDPNETFLHPDIKSRFVHNIGITGKKNYESWDSVKVKDNIFRVLGGAGFKQLTLEQKKIVSLRKKRLSNNNL